MIVLLELTAILENIKSAVTPSRNAASVHFVELEKLEGVIDISLQVFIP